MRHQLRTGPEDVYDAYYREMAHSLIKNVGYENAMNFARNNCWDHLMGYLFEADIISQSMEERPAA